MADRNNSIAYSCSLSCWEFNVLADAILVYRCNHFHRIDLMVAIGKETDNRKIFNFSEICFF